MSEHHRVAVVGTGFSGLGVAIALKQRGEDFVVLERGADFGGTWRDNTYPGCQCDVPSHLYSFSFAPNPDWSRTYSTQPEIWSYLRGVADSRGIRDHVRFNEEVKEASWDESTSRWVIETTTSTITADVLISGNGGLSEPSTPDLVGLETFTGTTFHSARWDHDHDLREQRVAVIGTGASSIQFVPKIQPDVAHLTLFQRTPAWVLPHSDRPIRAFERALYRRFPITQRIVRAFVYALREAMIVPMAKRPRLMRPVERLATRNLHKHIADPALRAKLTPKFTAGCKRLLLSDDYYPALARSNVTVETNGIAEVRERSIVTTDGTEHPVDTIIFGTGFRVTDNPIGERVRGAGGLTLAKAWEEGGSRAYLGTTVPQFPNLFLMTGPNTGIGHTSLVVMIEAQIRYVLDALRYMTEHRVGSVEVAAEPFEAFNTVLQSKMTTTVWNSGGCASWYLDAHGRNTTLWPDFTFTFAARTRRFDPENYIVVREGARMAQAVS